MWASRVDDEFGWEAWCRENEFNLENLQLSFRFKLPGASILTLDDPDQLINLPKLHPWEPKKPLEVAHPTLEQLREWYVPNWFLTGHNGQQFHLRKPALQAENVGSL